MHGCIGGTSTRDDDVQILSKGVHVVVGTPGHVHDMIQRRALDMSAMRMFILDDADEMMWSERVYHSETSISHTWKFKEPIYEIFNFLPERVQVTIFSVTKRWNEEGISKLMRDPVLILVKPEEHLSLDGIKQFFVAVETEEWKLDTLCDLYDTVTIRQSVIFCNIRKVRSRSIWFFSASALFCSTLLHLAACLSFCAYLTSVFFQVGGLLLLHLLCFRVDANFCHGCVVCRWTSCSMN